jgi:hypothetical protein
MRLNRGELQWTLPAKAVRSYKNWQGRMARYVRTKTDLQAALAEQRLALRSSASAYDQGHLWEAKRLATVAYTLLHDGTGRTKSLLTQMGLRGRLRFISTAREIEWMAPAIALVLIKTDHEGTACVPYCEAGLVPDRSVWLQFQSWWDLPIYKTVSGLVLCRKNLIFALRAQDGGAHFDGELPDNAYHPFATVNDERFKTGPTGSQIPIPNAHLASMRQIGWEIEETLKSYDQMPL